MCIFNNKSDQNKKSSSVDRLPFGQMFKVSLTGYTHTPGYEKLVDRCLKHHTDYVITLFVFHS